MMPQKSETAKNHRLSKTGSVTTPRSRQLTTRKACSLVTLRFTGSEALKWQVAYVDVFALG